MAYLTIHDAHYTARSACLHNVGLIPLENQFTIRRTLETAPNNFVSSLIRAPFSVARFVISGGYYLGSFKSVIKAIIQYVIDVGDRSE